MHAICDTVGRCIIHTLLQQVLRPGRGLSTRPTPQSRVKVRTSGVLEDDSGAVVDRHNAVSFTVGDGDVIQGMCVCVQWVMVMSFRVCVCVCSG